MTKTTNRSETEGNLYKAGMTTQHLFSGKNRQWINAIYQIPVGVMISDVRDHTVLVVNPALEKILGIDETLLTGSPFTQTFSRHGGQFSYPDQTVFNSDTFTRHFLSPGHLVGNGLEIILHRPNARSRVVLISSSPMVDENRQVFAVTSVFHDITELKHEKKRSEKIRQSLEEELRLKSRDLKEMNDKLQTIYNNSSESIWVCDGSGSVISINRASEELLGIRAADVVGKGIDELLDEGFMDQSVTQMVLDSRRQESMIQVALKTGKKLLVTGTPVFGDDGNISMIISNERDLTQLNQLQEELQQVKLEKSRMKDELSQLNLKELEDHNIVAQSKEMQGVVIACRKLADLNISSILILGESGTGKGLMAKYIHHSNSSLTGPMVKINCAAVPENLLEAELFGYEPGAFTGAKNNGKMGLFEFAKNGTLFLDEIGELSLPLQAKLLTCLEEKEIMHLGGLEPIKISCNIIAATNEDLPRKIRKKQFRQDLFFRLNTFPVTIPPLRNRPEDIMELSLVFLKKYNKAYKLSRWISAIELKRIQSYSFPGNVRELKNSIKKAVIMADKNNLERVVDTNGPAITMTDAHMDIPSKPSKGFNQQVAEFEKQLLAKALEVHSTTRALATALSMTQSQVTRKLKKHGLSHCLAQNRRTV